MLGVCYVASGFRFVVMATHSYTTPRHFTQWHWLHAMQVMRYHIVTEVPDPSHEIFTVLVSRGPGPQNTLTKCMHACTYYYNITINTTYAHCN